MFVYIAKVLTRFWKLRPQDFPALLQFIGIIYTYSKTTFININIFQLLLPSLSSRGCPASDDGLSFKWLEVTGSLEPQ